MEERNTIQLEDENGGTYELEVLHEIEIDGDTFIVAQDPLEEDESLEDDYTTVVSNEDGDIELIRVFKKVSDDDGDRLEEVTDEEADKVLEELGYEMEDEEDGDEECCEDCDEECCEDCDEVVN